MKSKCGLFCQIAISYTITLTCCVRTAYASGLLADLVNVTYSDLNVTIQCQNDLSQIANGLQQKDVWALKCKKIFYLVGFFFFSLNTIKSNC